MRPDIQRTPLELLTSAYPVEDGGGFGDGTGVQIKRLSHRHHAIMDFMLANPALPMSEVAEEFGVTQAWLSTVRNSDLFKARFNERRALMDIDQHTRITARLAKVAERGLVAMEDALEDAEESTEMKHAIAKTALESLGFLGKHAAPQGQQGQPVVQVAIGGDVFAQAKQAAMQGHVARPVNGSVDYD